MSPEIPDYGEDERILSDLSDPMDLEAFSNLMDYAHQQGMSAADFVREEPQRTSRKIIRKLCLRDHKRSLWAQIASVINTLWERPAENPEAALMQSLHGPRPPGSGKSGPNGRV